MITDINYDDKSTKKSRKINRDIINQSFIGTVSLEGLDDYKPTVAGEIIILLEPIRKML